MQSPCLREFSQAFLPGCCKSQILNFSENQENPTSNSKSKTTSMDSRRDFAAKTSSFFPKTYFTNHESLPSLQDSFNEFTNVYPQYFDTEKVDEIRACEYSHLSQSKQVCLDYNGIGLFSNSQASFPSFSVLYKSVNLKEQLLRGKETDSELEHAIRNRIMGFLNIQETDYSMVFTANRISAFKVLAESYPFQSSPKLLTVYDYKSDAVGSMIDSGEKRGAKVTSAEFSWPRLRIHSSKLRKLVIRTRKKKKKRGLFVFPLQSRMTGARYSYQWMNMAEENGWHVLLDACALGPKDMDSLGLSLFQPDFIIYSFYKVFGENPSGFGCLFVKKSSVSVLENCKSTGIVSLVPEKSLYSVPSNKDVDKRRNLDSSRSFSGPLSYRFEQGESSEQARIDVDLNKNKRIENGDFDINCNGFDHVDSLGLISISTRTRLLINWLVNALTKLKHPNTEKGNRLVRIYGPKIKFDRGPALAFNVFDWKGEKVEPVFVQKLADRSNISLSYGFIHKICFSDQYGDDEKVLEKNLIEESGILGRKRKERVDLGVNVITASIGFLANFEDIYRLWVFVSQFLDADFVEKERWRYTALNQKTIEL